MDSNLLYTNEFLSSKRLIGDFGADEFIHTSFSNNVNKAALNNWLVSLTSNGSLKQIPTNYQHETVIVQSYKLPVWADLKLMAAGSSFFVRHSEQVMQLLGLLSLPYCYAAADGAMVLYLSQRLKNDGGKRLADTGQFIWDLMSPTAFSEDGKGFSSILKIRLTHAAARYYTQKSGRWDMNWGLPVNQEDMAGTNLSFSLIVIRGLRKLGHTISYSEQQSFLHLWNVIGWLLGIEDDLIAHNGKQANNLELAIRKTQFKSSEHGRDLTKCLINTFTGINIDSEVSPRSIQQLMRYLLGNEVADLLDLPPSTLPIYLPYFLRIASNISSLNSVNNTNIAYRQKYLLFKEQSI